MIGFQSLGGKELTQAMSGLSARVSRGILRDALLDASEILRVEMGVRAPRRPPHPDMADNMVAVVQRGEDSQQVVVAVGPAKRFFYASFVELGTAFMAAQPFARPAFDSTVSKVIWQLGQNVWLALAGRGIRRATVEDEQPVSGPGRLV